MDHISSDFNVSFFQQNGYKHKKEEIEGAIYKRITSMFSLMCRNWPVSRLHNGYLLCFLNCTVPLELIQSTFLIITVAVMFCPNKTGTVLFDIGLSFCLIVFLSWTKILALFSNLKYLFSSKLRIYGWPESSLCIQLWWVQPLIIYIKLSMTTFELWTFNQTRTCWVLWAVYLWFSISILFLCIHHHKINMISGSILK